MRRIEARLTTGFRALNAKAGKLRVDLAEEFRAQRAGITAIRGGGMTDHTMWLAVLGVCVVLMVVLAR